jgi:hypothetical protein
MAKLVVELESDKLEHAEEECSRNLRDIADKLDRADGRSNLVAGSCVDINGNKVGTCDGYLASLRCNGVMVQSPRNAERVDR